jgi:hypothetical protein
MLLVATYFTVRNTWYHMGAPTSGPGAQKFTDDDVLAAFDEEQRRSVGKIELSAKEIQEILNKQILPDETTVTRQAVDNRLGKMDGDTIARAQHGRSYLYRLPDDIDRLFRHEIAGTGPPSGGKGGQPSNDYIRESKPTDTKDDEREKEADETLVPDGGETLFERVSQHLGGTAFVVGVGAAILNYIAVMVVMFTISSISLMASTTALDRKIGRYVESLRADMYEIGGLIGFIRTAREQGRLYPEEPTTPVERAARLDVWAFGMMFAAIGVMALLGITVEMWGAEAVVNTLTPLGTLGILLAITVIMGFAAVFLWASVLAAIAINSARRWMRDDAPTTGGFE